MDQIEELELKSQVDPGDRLSFTLFLALVLHVLIVLIPSFKLPKTSNSSQTIEITLATHSALHAPEDAEFLAQHNQEASGTGELVKKLLTDQSADFADTEINKVSPLPQQRTTDLKIIDNQLVSTNKKSRTTLKLIKNPDLVNEKPEKELIDTDSDLDQKIASLQAQLSTDKQTIAKRPRLRVITSESAKESFDAQYLTNWSNKIEHMGENNYPKEALNQRVSGNLRLSVIINFDGSVYDIEILQSSGKRMLDEAAKQIVRRSAPFSAFSAELRKNADRLQIIRTWKFEIINGSANVTTSEE